MIRFKRFVDLAARSVMLVALVGAAHAASSSTAADEAAIRAQTTAWTKAYNARDVAGVTAQYADDAILLPPGSPGAKGRAAIQAFFTKDIADSKAAGVVFIIGAKTDVGVSGSMGWESGTYTATIKGAAVEAGKFLSMSRKTNGKWQYIRDTWNADAPPAAAAAAPAAPQMTLMPVAPPKK